MGKARPETVEPIHNLDEMNVARLSLISIQRQVNPDYTSWEMDFDLEGVPVRVHCGSTVQVPHGIDTEVYLAILKLYQLNGSPNDGEVSVTPHELMRTAGIFPTARNYQMLHNSLVRLNRAIYQIDRGWRDYRGKRWFSLTFQHISKLEYTKNEDHHLDSASVLKITLPQDTVKSLQAGYLNPLSYQLLQQLKQPTSVALCRTLEALRRDATTTEVVRDRIEYPLVQWAKTLRLEDSRPDNIRRTLKKPHEELIASKYLRSVEYVGRGSKQTVVYELVPLRANEAEEEAVALLTARGVAVGSARALVAEYPDRIREALQTFEQLKATGYPMKAPGGLLVNIIKNPQNYDAPAQKASSGKKQALVKTEEQVLAEEQLSLEERIKSALYMMRNRINAMEQDLLQHLLETEVISVDSLQRELISASVNHRLDEYIGELKETLRQQHFEVP